MMRAKRAIASSVTPGELKQESRRRCRRLGCSLTEHLTAPGRSVSSFSAAVRAAYLSGKVATLREAADEADGRRPVQYERGSSHALWERCRIADNGSSSCATGASAVETCSRHVEL